MKEQNPKNLVVRNSMKVIFIFLGIFFLISCAAGRKAPLSSAATSHEKSPERTASMALISQGEKSLETGLYGQAQDRFQEAVNIDPSNGVGYYDLAVVKFKTGEYGGVWGFLEKAEQLLLGSPDWTLKIEDMKREVQSYKPD